MEESKRNCVDCGYLCWAEVVDGTITQIIQVTTAQRQSGVRPHGKYAHAPYCSTEKGEAILDPTLQYKTGDPPQGPEGKQRRYLEVINTDRNCTSHRKYTPGLTPDQHKIDAKAEIEKDEADRKTAAEKAEKQADEVVKEAVRLAERSEDKGERSMSKNEARENAVGDRKDDRRYDKKKTTILWLVGIVASIFTGVIVVGTAYFFGFNTPRIQPSKPTTESTK